MPPRSSVFCGLWIPLVTPFKIDGSVDHPALTTLVQHYVDVGVHGLVVCGSTGEAAALDDTEQLAALATVLQASGECPVVMGISGYNLPQTQTWIRTLNRYPLAGLLVAPPHYIRPSQAGVIEWFQTLADASATPMVIYDIPYRTGVTLNTETLLQLAAHPNIQAVKDCGGDIVKTLTLIADGRLNVLTGDDIQMFATLAQGGHGAIAASAHLQTARILEMLAHLQAGKLADARVHWHALVPLIHLLFAEPNPAPVKALLADRGFIPGGLRAPMQAVSPALLAQLRTTLQRVEATPGCWRAGDAGHHGDPCAPTTAARRRS